MGLSYSEDCIYAPTNSILTATYGTLQILHYDDDDDDPIILAWVIFTQCQHVTDRRMDGRTDGRIYDS